MTTSAGQFPLIGAQPVTNSSVTGVEVATATSGYVPLIPLGTIISVNDPFWGGLELVRLSVPAATLVRLGSLSTLTATYGYVAVPVAANLGQSVAVSFNHVPSNASFVQYAWFVIGGKYLVNSTASIAADTALGTAASVGQAAANSAGKQILNARVQVAATATVVKPVNTTSGSAIVRTNNSDGLFVGQTITGTGIPASSYIGAIDAAVTPVAITLTAADLVTAALATVTGFPTATATNNDATRFWNTVTMSRPFVQGAIT